MALENRDNADYGSGNFSTTCSYLVTRGIFDNKFHGRVVECSDVRGIVHGSVVERVGHIFIVGRKITSQNCPLVGNV